MHVHELRKIENGHTKVGSWKSLSRGIHFMRDGDLFSCGLSRGRGVVSLGRIAHMLADEDRWQFGDRELGWRG